MADLKEAQIGAALRRLREGRKLSLEALGKRTGVNHSYIGQLERGEIGSPRLLRVLALCEGLGITVNDLLVEAGLMQAPAGYRAPTPDDAPATRADVLDVLRELGELRRDVAELR